MRILMPISGAVLLLAACSSAPPLPSADDAPRRPVNAPAAVELQSCRHELHNSRIEVNESRQQVAAQTTRLLHWAQQPPVVPAPPVGNTVVTVRFAYGSSQADVPAALLQALVPMARAAPLVVLRGRTDGSVDSFTEARIARERAIAVRDVLVAAGVEPTRIRTTYQPAGDHVADNDSPSGRELNRRVEIELYRVLPVPQSLQALAATPTALPDVRNVTHPQSSAAQ